MIKYFGQSYFRGDIVVTTNSDGYPVFKKFLGAFGDIQNNNLYFLLQSMSIEDYVEHEVCYYLSLTSDLRLKLISQLLDFHPLDSYPATNKINQFQVTLRNDI